MKTKHIFLAIPLMDEWDNLTYLVEDIQNQTCKDFTVVFCVNQPDTWWNEHGKLTVCENNARTLDYLNTISTFQVKIIDRSSPTHGWKAKEYGVGWARKVCMDVCIELAENEDIIISLDGDTRFGADYLQTVLTSLNEHPTSVALSVPYYHRLTGKEEEDRAILRYEIYMRYYVLNLWRIQSPYCFTALGSAIAFPVKSYHAIRGITPAKSGEDFYFLQKLRKYGKILFWNPEKVYPCARFSDRVFFGTGPAMIKGNNKDWSSYPLYSIEHFDDIAKTYSLFPDLFQEKIKTPLDDFLQEIFNEDDIWTPIRANHPKKERFVRACYEKVDGLRILQYLKTHNTFGNSRDELHLKQYLNKFVDIEHACDFVNKDDFEFNTASIHELDAVRNLLAHLEEQYQIENFQSFNL